MLDFKYKGAFNGKLFGTYMQDVIFTLGINEKQGHFKCHGQAINYLHIRKDRFFCLTGRAPTSLTAMLANKVLKIFDYYDSSHCSIKIFAN